MKLLSYKNHILQLPENRVLRNKLYDLSKSDCLVIADDKVKTRATRTIRINFRLDDLSFNKLLSNQPKYTPGNCLVVVYLRGKDYTSLEQLVNADDYYVNVRCDKVDDSLLGQLMVDDAVSNDIKQSAKTIKEFAVGRVNGPTDKVVNDVTINGVQIKYDVNSRIEINSKGYYLRYTFKMIPTQNMAKLILPNHEDRVVLQQDFDLFTLGVFVLTQDSNDVVTMFNDLINKYSV